MYQFNDVMNQQEWLGDIVGSRHLLSGGQGSSLSLVIVVVGSHGL